jgi:DNA-directed RNA polymerase subunit RPC12/RpoP
MVNMDETCSNCGAEWTLCDDEDEPGGVRCSACGYPYHECGRCGETVPEAEWEEGVSMCSTCWDATTSQAP